jgi:hypothetical protein
LAFTLASSDASSPFELSFRRNTNLSWSIQSVEQTIAYRDLILQPNGGNVGIATPSPTATLEVSGTISATHFVGNGSGLTGLSPAAATGL